MKASHIAVLTLLGAGVLAGCTVYEAPPPRLRPRPTEVEVRVEDPGHAAVEIGVFEDELSPYGEWVERPAYGRVFLPSGLRAGWRPYTLGRWVHSDYGWTWVSEEPFGWATFHYGRWAYDPELGWLWVPGREWAPAWVAWQHGGGYIGWAPLPPAVGFRAGVGLDFGAVNLSVDIAPHAYAFVEERTFLAPHVTAVIVPPARNVTIIHNTTNITNYTVINNRIVNQSIDVPKVEQVTGQKVTNYQITDVKVGDRQRSARIEGNRIALYRPAIKAAQTPAAVPARTGSGEGSPSDQTATPPRVPKVSQGQPPATKAVSPEEQDRRHSAENRALDKHHAAERKRMEALHQRDLRDPKAQQNDGDVKSRHQNELQALDEQHQREKQQLEARHRLEKQSAARAAVKKNDKRKEQEKEKERPPAA